MLLRFVYERRDTSIFRHGARPIGRFLVPTDRQADLHTLGSAKVRCYDRPATMKRSIDLERRKRAKAVKHKYLMPLMASVASYDSPNNR